MTYVPVGGLHVAKPLYDLIRLKAAPGTGVTDTAFWAALEKILHDLSPRNRELLAKRQYLQDTIDSWHKRHKDGPHDAVAYEQFLREIGYIVPEGLPFSIGTRGVDPEISSIAGPQLVFRHFQ